MSKPLTGNDAGMSFWEHLDILRATLIRIVVVWCLFSIVAFIFKTEVFSVVLAPRNSGFITYRWLENICIGMGLSVPDAFDIELINTGLARQFMIHMKTAFCVGLLFVSPYALYEIFLFISPALYRNERKYASGIIVSGYAMFVIGILLSYFVIFPITFRFLGTYQVADDVVNMISLESYMATLIMMCLCMGVVCELPVLSWLLAKMGIISSSFMAAYRRHARCGDSYGCGCHNPDIRRIHSAPRLPAYMAAV